MFIYVHQVSLRSRPVRYLSPKKTKATVLAASTHLGSAKLTCPLYSFKVSSNVPNENWLRLDKESVQIPPPASRRKSGCLTQPFSYFSRVEPIKRPHKVF